MSRSSGHRLTQRESKIAAELADAAAKERKRRRSGRDSGKRTRSSTSSARPCWRQTEEAGAERHRLFDEARRASRRLDDKAPRALRNDARNLNRAILSPRPAGSLRHRAKSAGRSVHATLEERMVEVFVHRVREMDAAATKTTLADATEAAAARGRAAARSSSRSSSARRLKRR